jgi:ABC-type transport system involved in cytochrome bd biosynthesis fused ATPase/permease subunit
LIDGGGETLEEGEEYKIQLRRNLLKNTDLLIILYDIEEESLDDIEEVNKIHA